MVKSDTADVELRAWKRPGTVMLRVGNPGDKPADVALKLDLEKLGVKVPRVWKIYTQAVGAKSFDAPTGDLLVSVPAKQSKLVFVDTY
jgi:hypothetical protein